MAAAVAAVVAAVLVAASPRASVAAAAGAWKTVPVHPAPPTNTTTSSYLFAVDGGGLYLLTSELSASLSSDGRCQYATGNANLSTVRLWAITTAADLADDAAVMAAGWQLREVPTLDPPRVALRPLASVYVPSRRSLIIYSGVAVSGGDGSDCQDLRAWGTVDAAGVITPAAPGQCIRIANITSELSLDTLTWRHVGGSAAGDAPFLHAGEATGLPPNASALYNLGVSLVGTGDAVWAVMGAVPQTETGGIFPAYRLNLTTLAWTMVPTPFPPCSISGSSACFFFPYAGNFLSHSRTRNSIVVFGGETWTVSTAGDWCAELMLANASWVSTQAPCLAYQGPFLRSRAVSLRLDELAMSIMVGGDIIFGRKVNLWQDAWALPDNDVQWRALAGSNVEAPFNLNANVPPLRSAVGTVQRLSTAEFPWPAYRLWLWGGVTASGADGGPWAEFDTISQYVCAPFIDALVNDTAASPTLRMPAVAYSVLLNAGGVIIRQSAIAAMAVATVAALATAVTTAALTFCALARGKARHLLREAVARSDAARRSATTEAALHATADTSLHAAVVTAQVDAEYMAALTVPAGAAAAGGSRSRLRRAEGADAGDHTTGPSRLVRAWASSGDGDDGRGDGAAHPARSSPRDAASAAAGYPEAINAADAGAAASAPIRGPLTGTVDDDVGPALLWADARAASLDGCRRISRAAHVAIVLSLPLLHLACAIAVVDVLLSSTCSLTAPVLPPTVTGAAQLLPGSGTAWWSGILPTPQLAVALALGTLAALPIVASLAMAAPRCRREGTGATGCCGTLVVATAACYHWTLHEAIVALPQSSRGAGSVLLMLAITTYELPPPVAGSLTTRPQSRSSTSIPTAMDVPAPAPWQGHATGIDAAIELAAPQPSAGDAAADDLHAHPPASAAVEPQQHTSSHAQRAWHWQPVHAAAIVTWTAVTVLAPFIMQALLLIVLLQWDAATVLPPASSAGSNNGGVNISPVPPFPLITAQHCTAAGLRHVRPLILVVILTELAAMCAWGGSVTFRYLWRRRLHHLQSHGWWIDTDGRAHLRRPLLGDVDRAVS